MVKTVSVYTNITEQELKQFLTQYNLGALRSFEGISAGIENTNYFVDTSKGRFVLTIFEHHTINELDYFLNIMAFMAEHNIPTAHPEKTTDGHYLKIFKEKPAALVKRLTGSGVEEPSLTQVGVMGEQLAKFHIAGQDFNEQRNNDRDLNWIQKTYHSIVCWLPADEITLIAKEIEFQSTINWSILPQGVIHADLFCDNALFEGDKLSGIIDLYYACNATLLYDLAVMTNDWCKEQTKDSTDEINFKFNAEKVAHMMSAYNQIRPLTKEENNNWQAALRLAALRFFLSRLKDKYTPREGEMTQIKNPSVYKKILQIHQTQP